MAIKYECDVCGEIKNPADVYGPGTQPSPSSFTYTVDRVCVEIMVHQGMPTDHVCGACLGQALRAMVEEVWPQNHTPEQPNEINPGSDSSDSDVREVRAEPEVRGTGPDVYTSPGTGSVCPSCKCKTYANPPLDCKTRELHHPRRGSGAFGGQEG